MKRKLSFALLVLLAAALMTACIHVQEPGMPPPGEPLPGYPIPGEPMPEEPGPGMQKEPVMNEPDPPFPGEIDEEAISNAMLDHYAVIKTYTQRPDGQVDITFDWVEWLKGAQAENQFITDTGGTKQDAQAAGVTTNGYVWNPDHNDLDVLRTDTSTEFVMPDGPSNLSSFMTRVPSMDESNGLYPYLVRVTYLNGVISRLECVIYQ
jgi:hypothetical protein